MRRLLGEALAGAVSGAGGLTTPLPGRAPRGGYRSLGGRVYRGGEFTPFYVPREAMPQVDEADLPALFDFLRASRVLLLERQAQPWSLFRPHQRISFHMAATMDEATFRKPILVALDGFILDGNHRWMDHKLHDAPVNCFIVEQMFEAAIASLFRFPKTYSYGDGKPHAFTH